MARPRFTEATIEHGLGVFGTFPESEKWETLITIADAVRKYGTFTDRISKIILEGRAKKVFRLKDQNVFSAVLIDKHEVSVLLRNDENTASTP